MSPETQRLFDLLPAIHRLRDAELARALGLARGPLEELVTVLAEQLEVAEEGLEQLHDDLFIETCADWVVPYLGDLIGYRGLHDVGDGASARAEVAHTIALRRRKGTALVLEQLARDVTGWDARAVEYFQRLCTTQYMNHPRRHSLQSPDLRHGAALEWLDSVFESANRSVEVRRIESGRGRHNLPNVGLHLWRIRAYPHRDSPATRAGPRRYRASPLGHDLPLYNRPRAEDDITHLAEPDNVPLPLTRRRLHEALARHYGAPDAAPRPALSLRVGQDVIPREQIRICNLSDEGASWAHTPPPDGTYALDPVLGRIALPADAPDPADVWLHWQEGFCADLGGGEYSRLATLPTPADTTNVQHVPDDQPTLAAALTALGGDGVIEITNSARYSETLTLEVAAGGSLEIRAADVHRPTLDLGGLSVHGGEHSACRLNGLLITGTPLSVPDADGNALSRLELAHCTLVPGIGLNPDGSPTDPVTPSLRLELAGLETRLTRCIVGGVRSHERAAFRATDCLIDAIAPQGVAYAALDDEGPGAVLSLCSCTVIGKLHASEIALVSNTILLAALTSDAGWAAPVLAVRKQIGCVRYSWLPLASIVPRRHRCQPDPAADGPDIAPRFNSLHYGTPAYGQLAAATPPEILCGADDESEMGVYHHLAGALRETNLRIRLAEYLRVSLRAGIFHES
ncbi:hypothetical protein FEI13_04015 [Halomonas urmiana]|uniref:Phage tail protein n=1 Tax=Halomonas urmiana TaxID=490901 RepID=A0A5R8ML46_9GAMM|nr:hypothetical protein [Halomonas urmiana]TLF52876.1 hypothetical protein FEI13_04015 [Halomonas urmiana]